MTAQIIGPGGTVDVSDRAGREVGVVSAAALDVSLSTLRDALRGAPSGTLEAVRALLAATLTVGGTVGLDAPTLAALETIQVGNLPATQPVSGAVALDASTLTALEQVEARSPLKALALDYVARTDSQPVYLGTAAPATADATAAWTVTRFTYESTANDARATRSDVRSPIRWTSRTDPTLDGQPAW